MTDSVPVLNKLRGYTGTRRKLLGHSEEVASTTALGAKHVVSARAQASTPVGIPGPAV